MVGVLEYAALVIIYSLLAATVLEALLYAWRVKNPFLATRFRLLTLAVPPVVPLLFLLMGEGGQDVRRQIALLDLSNWLGSAPSLGHPGWLLIGGAMAATTLLLIGREAADVARQISAGRMPVQPLASLPEQLQRTLRRLKARGLRLCPVLAVAQPEAVASAVGVRQPKIVLSTGLLDLLDEEELEAVLAHEMAHVDRRDNHFGWLLFALRLGSFYNPVALFVFHQISHDVERICDSDAADMTGRPLALGSALIKVFGASRGTVRGRRAWSQRFAQRAATLEKRARRALVVDRVERLVHPEIVKPVSFPRLRLALSIASISSLAYLVVY
jgi:Zn-dependent protease with chaperone function